MELRFLDKVSVGDGCWEWQAGLVGGYGRFVLNRQHRRAHRIAYELMVGPIPDGLQLDHLCRNRRCVRPDHLEPVTQRENLLRGVTIPASNAIKTHCPSGHEYTPENTRLSKRNQRHCRTCNRKAA